MWVTTNVITMSGMFNNLTSGSPDVSNFDFTGLGGPPLNASDAIVDFINGSAISDADYTAFLINLDSQTIQPSVTVKEIGPVDACFMPSAATARTSLISKGWTINDLGACL
jgi:hypothetical protein